MFCKIIKKEVPAKIVYEDADVVVFPDITPKARVHLLIVPTAHIKSFLDLREEQLSVLTKMSKVVQRLIVDQKLTRAYQLLFNGGKHQHVPHLHLHLMAE